jgi:hypothetical protein
MGWPLRGGKKSVGRNCGVAPKWNIIGSVRRTLPNKWCHFLQLGLEAFPLVVLYLGKRISYQLLALNVPRAYIDSTQQVVILRTCGSNDFETISSCGVVGSEGEPCVAKKGPDFKGESDPVGSCGQRKLLLKPFPLRLAHIVIRDWQSLLKYFVQFWFSVMAFPSQSFVSGVTFIPLQIVNSLWLNASPRTVHLTRYDFQEYLLVFDSFGKRKCQ